MASDKQTTRERAPAEGGWVRGLAACSEKAICRQLRYRNFLTLCRSSASVDPMRWLFQTHAIGAIGDDCGPITDKCPWRQPRRAYGATRNIGDDRALVGRQSYEKGRRPRQGVMQAMWKGATWEPLLAAALDWGRRRSFSYGLGDPSVRRVSLLIENSGQMPFRYSTRSSLFSSVRPSFKCSS